MTSPDHRSDEQAARRAGVRRTALIVAAIAVVVYIRSKEHTSELQSLMRISYAVFCLKKKNKCLTHDRLHVVISDALYHVFALLSLHFLHILDDLMTAIH